MAEHRAFGNAGGAAGVLQKCDVVVADLDAGRRLPRACCQGRVETHGVGDRIGRHHFLHVAQREVHNSGLGKTEQIAQARGDDVLARRVVKDFSQHRREVVEDDDGARPGVMR